MHRVLRALGPAALILSVGTLAACPGGRRVKPCGQIPPDGCPVGRGGTCRDPFCADLYDCVDGRWQVVQSCPGFGGQGGGGAGGGEPQGGGGGSCTGVFIDRSGETTGCEPDLVLPDCVADAAESCHPCTTGCIDFFLCTAQGWQSVAFCTQDGELIIEP